MRKIRDFEFFIFQFFLNQVFSQLIEQCELKKILEIQVLVILIFGKKMKS